MATVTNTVECSTCGEHKSIDDYQWANRSSGKKHRYCKMCASEKRKKQYWSDPKLHRARTAEARKRRIEKHGHDRIKAEYRDYNLRKNYGISVEDYEEMLSAQNGACAICHSPPTSRRLHVDHCHSTGAVRGLLCSQCNVGIGMAREDPSILSSMADYLRGDQDSNDD